MDGAEVAVEEGPEQLRLPRRRSEDVGVRSSSKSWGCIARHATVLRPRLQRDRQGPDDHYPGEQAPTDGEESSGWPEG